LLADRGKRQGIVNAGEAGGRVNAVAAVPLFEAVSGLEFRVAMHNIRELGIRRLLEGFPRGVMK
jgi:hypothetical protein